MLLLGRQELLARGRPARLAQEQRDATTWPVDDATRGDEQDDKPVVTDRMQKTDDCNQRCRFSALASGVWKSGNADSSRLPGPGETDIREVH